jgi:O-antigen ligase
MTRPITAPNLDQVMIREILLIGSFLFCFIVIHGYVGLTRVIKGLVAGGVVSSVVAIVASLTGSESAPQLRLPGLVKTAPLYFTSDDMFREGMVRAQGSASHPLELACVLTIIFPLALSLTLSLRATGKRWWPWAVATALVVGGIVVSVSRSGAIGLIVALAVMACYWPIRRTLAMLAAGSAVLAVGVVLQAPAVTGYLAIFGADRSVEQRVAVTSALPFDISLFGTYGLGVGRQVPRNPAAEIPTLDDQYLKVLAEQGVLGLVAYVALVGTTLAVAFLAFKNARNRVNAQLPQESAPLFLGIAASFAAYAVVTFFLDAAGFLQIWTTMWLLIAIAAVAYRISRRPIDEISGVIAAQRTARSSALASSC